MTSKEIYEAIDFTEAKKLGIANALKKNLTKSEKDTKGFTIKDTKIDSAMSSLYQKLKKQYPTVLKDVTIKTVKKKVEVPTTKKELDILKYKPVSRFNSFYLTNE